MSADTKTRLLEVAIDLFGRDGKSATGTRAIAEAAGVPMSAITYHFGGKDELYLACANHLAQEMRRRMSSAHGRRGRQPTDPQEAFLGLLSDLVTVLMPEDAAPIARFVIREQMDPSPAFELLYDGVIGEQLRQAEECLGRIVGARVRPQELRIRVLALVGQVPFFRFARATLLRAMGWRAVGPRETEQIRATVLAHARAILHDLAVGETA